ncbi:Pesticidal crystal protein cry22Aa [Thalassoglobus neptunius]|uniref:Pesticidal crystal protein cry22Aa n=1 Tax=Thalassoglobus neptunius TaxID=1938619 RepID=A0A5C5VSH4_9PLAN|nr:PKD domain-containing protein [Thalassoglobus neptunius]TWT40855.1 Pesticidal crystal protein cry22Aa [Thalassoglobus neptunius]
MTKHIRNSLLWLFFAGFALTACRHSFAEGDGREVPRTFFIVVDVSGSMSHPFRAPVQPVLTNATKLHDVKRRLAMLAAHLPLQTRVIVTTFDTQAWQICDLRIEDESDRVQLKNKLAEIKTWNGSTYLWRNVDAQLAHAKQICEENPNDRVRVLLYTDGEDMERRPGLDHNFIIQKYGDSLQSVVELDWVTIGYDLEAKVKASLQESGVHFTRADKPEEIVPLRSGFILSTTNLKVGETLEFSDDSVGLEIVKRQVDWGDSSPKEQGLRLSHKYTVPGTYDVEYVITSKNGKTSTSRQQILVTNPSSPVAKIRPLSPDAKLLPGQELEFEDVSHGNCAQRRWEYGHDQTSSKQVLRAKFDQPGEHLVKLIVADEYGQTSQAETSVVIRRPAPPQAAIQAPTEPIIAGELVELIDASHGDVLNREWTYGNGQTSTEPILSVSFNRPGRQDVVLAVTDRFGQTTQDAVTLKIQLPPPPVARIRVEKKQILVNEPLTLEDASQGEIQSREWSFGDDEKSTLKQSTVNFSKPGEQVIVLVVADEYGQTSRATETIQVRLPEPPVARIATVKDAITLGETVTFADVSRGDIAKREWNFGSGQSSNEESLSLMPDQPGDVSVKLLVTDSYGQTVEAEQVIAVKLPPKPIASIIIPQKRQWQIGDELTLLSDSSASADRFQWIVDGADPLTTEHANVVVERSGELTITLTVWDRFDQATTATETLQVQGHAPPQAGFTIGTAHAFLGDTVRITSTATGMFDSVTFKVSSLATPIEISPAAKTPCFDYAADQLGTIQFEQIVVGPGGTDQLTRELKVDSRVIQPIAKISFAKPSRRGPQEVHFENRSTGSVVRTDYDFGDGSPVVSVTGAAKATHRFAPGNWPMKVTAFGPDDTTPSVWETTIDITEPIAAWIWNLAWQIPLAILFCGICWYLVDRDQQRRLLQAHSQLDGSLTVHPRGQVRQLRRFHFEGKSDREEIELDDQTRVLVDSIMDHATGEIKYRLEVSNDGKPHQSAVIDSGEQVDLSGFTLRYSE